jgi:predicted dinucleotide-binding enzyme
VTAFNTMASQVIELDREKLLPHRISVFLCSDDPQAKLVVSGLAEELGFVPVDSGEAEAAMNTGAGPGAHRSRAPVRIPHATCALLGPRHV